MAVTADQVSVTADGTSEIASSLPYVVYSFSGVYVLHEVTF